MYTFRGFGDVQGDVIAAADKYGVPEWLALAVAKTESAFNPAARSSAGAIGVMQLMPGTAAGLNVDPYNTSQNIDGGVRYLSQLLKQFNGDTTKAVAAYNAGPGAVTKYGGVPPYAETQNYVQKVLGANYVPDAGATAGNGFSLDSETTGDETGGGSELSPGGVDPWLIGGLALAGLAAVLLIE